MQPSFVGIGMQRCASSWLHRVLAEHPQINKPPSGLHFFNYNFKRGELWYSCELNRYFNGSGIIGEFSTTYSYPECFRKVSERMFSLYPNVKLIASIRHPMDRCYSDYLRSLRIGEISDQEFQKAILENPVIVQRSLYAPIIAAYLKVFLPEQFFFINYDNIIEDPSALVSRLYSFLGVDHEFRPSILQKRLGETYEMKNVRFEILLGKLQSKGRNFLHSIGLGKMIPMIKKSGIIKTLRKINTASIDIPPRALANEMDVVNSQFKKDIEETMKLTDMDLQAWLAN